jgi:hypothetical protein
MPEKSKEDEAPAPAHHSMGNIGAIGLKIDNRNRFIFYSPIL